MVFSGKWKCEKFRQLLITHSFSLFFWSIPSRSSSLSTSVGRWTLSSGWNLRYKFKYKRSERRRNLLERICQQLIRNCKRFEQLTVQWGSVRAILLTTQDRCLAFCWPPVFIRMLFIFPIQNSSKVWNLERKRFRAVYVNFTGRSTESLASSVASGFKRFSLLGSL